MCLLTLYRRPRLISNDSVIHKRRWINLNQVLLRVEFISKENLTRFRRKSPRSYDANRKSPTATSDRQSTVSRQHSLLSYHRVFAFVFFSLIMAEILRSFLYPSSASFSSLSNHSFPQLKSLRVESDSTDSPPPSRPPPKKIPKGVVLGADGKPSDFPNAFF